MKTVYVEIKLNSSTQKYLKCKNYSIKDVLKQKSKQNACEQSTKNTGWNKKESFNLRVQKDNLFPRKVHSGLLNCLVFHL